MFTKSKKQKTIIALLLSFILMLSMTTMVFAAEDAGTYEVCNTAIGFKKTGDYSARALVSSDTFSTASYIKATVTLLEYRNGSWIEADMPTTVQTKTVYNTSTISFLHNWSIEQFKSYKLKVVIEDKTGGNTFTDTSYSNSI